MRIIQNMKIILATPLFPPELGPSASYAYQLSQALSKEHSVSVVTFANQVEPLNGIHVEMVPKNKPLLMRLYLMT